MKEALKKIPLRVEKVDTLEFSIGIVLVLVSLLMPLAFNMHNFPVRRYLFEALRWSEKTFLMTAALLLVALNALRGIPHYVGAFSSASRSVLLGGARKQRFSTLR